MSEREQTLQYMREIYGTTVSEETLLRLFNENDGSLDRIITAADALNLEDEKKKLQAERNAKREQEASARKRETDLKVAALKAKCASADITDSFFVDVLEQTKGDVNQAAKMLEAQFSDFPSSSDGKKEKPEEFHHDDLERQVREQHEILARIEEQRKKEEQIMEEKIRRDFEEKKRREHEEKLRKEHEEREKREREESHRREQQERLRVENEEKIRKERIALEEERIKREKEDAERRAKEESLRLLDQQLDERKRALQREEEEIARKREEVERVEAEKRKIAEIEKKLAEQIKTMEEKEAKKSFESKANSKQEESPVRLTRPPKVCVYKQSDTVISQSDMDKLYAVCLLKDIAKEEVGVVDVTNNMDAQHRLVEMCGHFEYPMIFIAENPVGSFEQVMKLSREDGKFEALLRGRININISPGSSIDPAADLVRSIIVNPNPEIHELDSMTPEETEEQLRLGVVDGMLGVTESVLSGVSSIVTLPITILTWPFRSQVEENKLEDGDEDYLVIQSNWYARSQWRTYRFKKDQFYRLHPNGQVRAQHPYSAVKSIEYTDRKNIILHYHGDEAPDYLQATAENIQKMVKRWTTMNKDITIEGNGFLH